MNNINPSNQKEVIERLSKIKQVTVGTLCTPTCEHHCIVERKDSNLVPIYLSGQDIHFLMTHSIPIKKEGLEEHFSAYQDSNDHPVEKILQKFSTIL